MYVVCPKFKIFVTNFCQIPQHSLPISHFSKMSRISKINVSKPSFLVTQKYKLCAGNSTFSKRISVRFYNIQYRFRTFIMMSRISKIKVSKPSFSGTQKCTLCARNLKFSLRISVRFYNIHYRFRTFLMMSRISEIKVSKLIFLVTEKFGNEGIAKL